METHYQPLFKELGRLLSSNPTPQTWENIKVISSFFKRMFLRPQQSQEIIQDSPMEPVEEMKEAPPQQVEDYNFFSCCKCSQKFDEFQIDQIIWLEQCSHQICTECFKETVEYEYPRSQKASCPADGCQSSIMVAEIKAVVGRERFEEIEKEAMDSFMQSDDTMVKCNCGAVISLVQGDVDYNVKDDKGALISRHAAEHMSRQRVRCQGCQTIFCAECKTEPYHVGYTCAEKAQLDASVKCRFCQNPIEERKGPEGDVFRDVCDRPDCQEMINGSCPLQLECGHICHGFRGEEKCLPCIDPECVEKNPDITLSESADDFCSICFISGLGDKPTIQLGCKHMFHVECLLEKIRQKWSGP